MLDLRVFLSYSSHDRNLAGTVKKVLEDRYGLSVFLAHEDIEPSVEWQQRILAELASVDVFVPILTENFARSNWTDQETGVAVGRSCIIVPLNAGVAPYGFIARFQAYDLTEANVAQVCEALFKGLFRQEAIGPRLRGRLIDALESSSTYDGAGVAATNLVAVEGYTNEELNRVLRASVENNQVYPSWEAQHALNSFFGKHERKLESGLYAKWRELIKSFKP